MPSPSPSDVPADLRANLPTNTAAVLAAIRAAEHADGRLPMPSADVLGDIFPFEGDMRVRRVDDPVLPEPPRNGEDAGSCFGCERADHDCLWVHDRWRLTTLPDVGSLPAVVLLEPRRHLDLGDLDDDLAAELGRMTVAIEQAMRALDGVGRVHVNRWGDGGAHLHIWFLARPAGLLQLRGSCLTMWLDVLPPIAADRRERNLRAVAAGLQRRCGGRVVKG